MRLESGRQNRATYTKQRDDRYEGPGSRSLQGVSQQARARLHETPTVNLLPLVEAVSRDQASASLESVPKRGRSIDALHSGVDRPVADLCILRPVWDQAHRRSSRER